MNDHELTVEKMIPAAREKVFEAWLDPKALAKFMTPAPGMSVPKAECEAKVGGAFLIVMRAGDKDLPHSGTYEVIDRFDRLAFTWLSAHAGEGSLVTLRFEALSDHETKVTLHHAGLATAESRDNHQSGWTAILAALGCLLA